MKLVLSELDQNYATYSFGYTPHALIEHPADVPLAYETGFLPYSHKPTELTVFYMARSLRIVSECFKPTSENRRIAKKYDGQFSFDYITDLGGTHAHAAKALFSSYFDERHGKDVMPQRRLDDIFSKPLPLRLVRYIRDNETIAYVLECIDEGLVHFWFSCFTKAYFQSSLGMWLIQDSIRRACKENRSYVYLGTGYGKKARYKMNIPNLEFWNGAFWINDEKKLTELLIEDYGRETSATSRFY